MSERGKKGGRAILDNSNSTTLVQCTFRTEAYNKARLIEIAENRGQTLSETLSDLLTYKLDEKDYKQIQDIRMQNFIEMLSNSNPKTLEKLINMWNEIKLKIK